MPSTSRTPRPARVIRDGATHCQLMRDIAVRRVTVVDKGQAVGIVTIGDLAVALDAESALADISAAPPND